MIKIASLPRLGPSMEAETLHSKGVKFALTQFEANQIKVVEVN